jgi:hypothetical protein
MDLTFLDQLSHVHPYPQAFRGDVSHASAGVTGVAAANHGLIR